MHFLMTVNDMCLVDLDCNTDNNDNIDNSDDDVTTTACTCMS